MDQKEKTCSDVQSGRRWWQHCESHWKLPCSSCSLSLYGRITLKNNQCEKCNVFDFPSYVGGSQKQKKQGQH